MQKISVGKRTLGTSVSAKLEPSFDYKRKEFLTTDKLYQAVADAINRSVLFTRIKRKYITDGTVIRGRTVPFYHTFFADCY